jgi:signal transduction histidine kinase
MFKDLQAQLAAWFVSLSLLLYALSGLFAIFVFDSSLTYSLDEELKSLSVEMMPAVKFNDQGKPTLAPWAANMNDESLSLLDTIQLFDAEGHFLERYGEAGARRLGVGSMVQGEGKNFISVRSLNEPINRDGKLSGYLQVQISTRQRDKAVHEFAATTLLVAPFLALGLGLSSYFLSQKAVQPMKRTMDMLRRFVADAGHELKTPISVIEAAAQTLDDTLAAHNISNEVVGIISRASQRMKELSYKLVLLARLENPELTSSRVSLKVDEALEPVLTEFRELAKNKNIEFSCPSVAGITMVADGESLRTLVSNLLENAVRYTDPGGKIALSISQSARQVTMVVEDTGIGIPREHLGHIFERFYRVDKSRTRALGGSGLGLSIVKAIVDAHHGSVFAESEPGHGSKFTVNLPC